MKKRLICIFLCVVLMAGLMPSFAFADYISEARFTVETPYGGYTLPFEADTEQPRTQCGYFVPEDELRDDGFVNGVRWKDLATGRTLSPGDKFVAGGDYQVSILAKHYYSGREFGYKAPSKGDLTAYYLTDFYVNGSEAQAKPDNFHASLPGKFAIVSYTFENIPAAPPAIESVGVKGISAPIAGETGDNIADVLGGQYKICTDSGLYDPYGVMWISPQGIYQGKTPFAEGSKYTVSVVLEAIHPYRFAVDAKGNIAMSAAVNGQKATLRPFVLDSAHPADRYVLVEYEFPAAEKGISFVEVSIPEPQIGNAITEAAKCGEGYSSYTVMWSEDGRLMDSGDRFRAGHSYSVEIWVKAQSGFAVDDNFDPLVTGTVNGNAAKVTRAYEQEASQVIALHYDFGQAESHEISYVAARMPTCTEAGKQAYFRCSCGDCFEDALGAKAIADIDTWGVIPALGHTPAEIRPDGDEHWAWCPKCKAEIPGTREKHFSGSINDDGSAICEWCGAKFGGNGEKQPIAYIALEIKEPVAGIEANFSVTDKSSGAVGAVGYDFYGPTPVKWYDMSEGRYLVDGDKFVKGHRYSIDVCLYAEDGYAFAVDEGQPLVTAQLNWNFAEVYKMYGMDPEKYISLSYEFPALGEHEHVFIIENDADYHWQVCRDCGVTQNKARHSADMQNVCTECGYQMAGAPDHDGGYVFPFTDVAESAWFYPWIKGAHQMGLINGKTATTYCPKDNMTYAEAIKLAACMHQLYHEGKVTLQNGKPDWRTSYYDYCRDKGIILAKSNGMEPGYEDLFAMASKPIDRQTYVYIFSRALPAEAFKEINSIPDNSIPDVPVSQGIWDDGIYLFYRAGILNGTDAKGTFKPYGNIQRSEVAAILNRMMDESVRVGAPADLGK